MNHATSNLDARVSSLETSMVTLAGSVETLTRHIDSLRNVVTDQQRPQWGNLIGAVGLSVTLVAAIGSSYIAPLTVTLAGHEKVFTERGFILTELQNRLREVEGVAATNRRVFEGVDNTLSKRMDTLETMGSGITRERLAVIESQVKEILSTRAAH